MKQKQILLYSPFPFSILLIAAALASVAAVIHYTPAGEGAGVWGLLAGLALAGALSIERVNGRLTSRILEGKLILTADGFVQSEDIRGRARWRAPLSHLQDIRVQWNPGAAATGLHFYFTFAGAAGEPARTEMVSRSVSLVEPLLLLSSPASVLRHWRKKFPQLDTLARAALEKNDTLLPTLRGETFWMAGQPLDLSTAALQGARGGEVKLLTPQGEWLLNSFREATLRNEILQDFLEARGVKRQKAPFWQRDLLGFVRRF